MEQLSRMQKVLIEDKDSAVVLKSTADVVECLAASVKVPARFVSLGVEEIIRRAKKEHHESRK